MSRTFAYARVSTTGQMTQNQIQEIEAAGFAVKPHRIISETISGSMPISRRPGFTRLIDRLEIGDVLVVTKLDRLGRDAMDVSATVQQLADAGVRVHCLALGGIDLASSAGKMTMHVINAVAQFERDLLVERTQSGLQRAKAEGKLLGRPQRLSSQQKQEALQDLERGLSISATARNHGVSRQTIMRLRNSSKVEDEYEK
ncbi:recombinase family protein [Pseudovibrio brasiliensis]|uniref:Recombinase family protein n=1 Tax=Pseudovibrio brasiliensis TaxID=1898042 RepID=A0ABX8AVB8_9HYPH|nr:recombinase family protein [Pseudovibrio brasiliensis]QUS58994.1 recombinase family protein [Pseudovibrio brasiliensis]